MYSIVLWNRSFFKNVVHHAFRDQTYSFVGYKPAGVTSDR
jgi:hypothetical protein